MTQKYVSGVSEVSRELSQFRDRAEDSLKGIVDGTLTRVENRVKYDIAVRESSKGTKRAARQLSDTIEKRIDADRLGGDIYSKDREVLKLELGSSKSRPNPILSPAFDTEIQRFESDIEDAIINSF